MKNPPLVSHDVIVRMMKKGIAQGHVAGAWATEPVAMHIKKSARHALTADLLMEHPEFCKDRETYYEHLELSLCRMAFAVTIESSKDGVIRCPVKTLALQLEQEANLMGVDIEPEIAKIIEKLRKK
jgi:hypothetical protein